MVGLNVPLTGAYARQGEDQLKAYTLAIDILNKSSGILGKRIVYAVRDTKTDPVVAKANAYELIELGAQLITGGVSFSSGYCPGRSMSGEEGALSRRNHPFQCNNGNQDRISSLLAAMKRFSHPGSTEMTTADLHEIIETALTVSRNEWKYVAEVITEFGADVPQIPLLIDQMGQVILNMVVNASQAIQEKRTKSGVEEMGVIKISTHVMDEEILLIFHDNGIGIEAAFIKKVFDPFFTTKEIGKGTGQGLAICHDVITKKHHGTLKVSSEEGLGTTFTIRLPKGKKGQKTSS